MKKILVLAAIGSLLHYGEAAAQTFNHTSSTQSWNLGTNWTPSSVPNSIGATANFNSPTANQTVSLNAAITVGSINLTNNGTFTFLMNNGAGGSLTLDVTSGNASINVGGTGTNVNTISSTTTLNDTVNISVTNAAPTSASGALTLTGAISGAGGLTKSGAGTLSLTTAAKTYSGATTVNEGILRVSEIAAPSSSISMTVETGGQLRLDSNSNRSWNVSAGTVTLNGTGGAANGALRFQGSLSLSESQSFSNAISLATTSSIHTEDVDGFINLTGAISGSGGLIKQGSGTLRLDAAATYGGDTSVINGTLRLNGADNRLPTGTVVSLGDGSSANLGTLDLNGRSQQVSGLNSVTGTNASASNNTVTSSTAATLTLGGSGSYSYGDGTNANSGVITGAISLIKTGSGTHVLGDANTYTGTTVINAGVLVVNGTHTGGGKYTVESGGTLGGTGTITANVDVNGGSIASGNSIGTLNVVGDVTWNGGASDWSFELGAGNTSDLLDITGSFLKGTGTRFNFDFGNSTQLGTFKLVDWSSNVATGFSISDFTFTGLGGGNLGSFSFSGSQLNFTAVPEPSAFLLVGSVLTLAAVRRRRA